MSNSTDWKLELIQAHILTKNEEPWKLWDNESCDQAFKKIQQLSHQKKQKKTSKMQKWSV